MAFAANVRSKRFFSVKEVQQLLQTASDDVSFSESDSDRDSDRDDNTDVTLSVALECDDDGPSFLQQTSIPRGIPQKFGWNRGGVLFSAENLQCL